jgi:signal-transduction protein with cAMP-binding, CBS, and nucleotidyltransferase domain
VLSTKDLLIAVHASHDGQPLRDHMRAPAYTIRMDESLALATDRLAHAHVSGLCVVDEHEHPVGTFTQTEALAARDRPSETRVEEVMSYAMLCLDVRTPLYRAAAHAHATRARRVLAVEGGHVRGVLTGLDFARALAR